MNWQVTYREWLGRNNAPGAVEMTAAEWSQCPLASVMLRFLYAYPDGRRRRLFAVACLRRVIESVPPRFRPFIEVAEDYAEGRASAEQLAEAYACVGWMYEGDEDLLQPGEKAPCDCYETLTEGNRRFVYAVYRLLEAPAYYDHPTRWSIDDAAGWTAEGGADAIGVRPDVRYWDDVRVWKERAVQADLLRDIYGNPFRPVVFQPAWRTDAVMQFAEKIYRCTSSAAWPTSSRA